MLPLNDDREMRKMVTFYTIYTCIYVPLLLLTLAWSNGIYLIGKYKFNSILCVIVVAEMAKYLTSVLKFKNFKNGDVSLSKKHDKTAYAIIKQTFGRTKIKEAFKTFLTVTIMTAVFFIVAILYGAELFTHHEETFMFSALLSTLTVIPACINLGSCSVVSFLFGNKSNDKLEILLSQNLYFTIFGAWLGAFVIPLDWDRPWQKWPIPCCVGAICGFLLSHIVMIFQIKFGPNEKETCLHEGKRNK